MKKILLIVLLLIVGCSSDDKEAPASQASVEKESEKEAPVSQAREPIDRNTLITSISGLQYAPGSDKPYSGESVLYYESGQKMSEGTWKDGKEDGLWTGWYENGQKMLEGTYKDGELNGLWTGWYKNGQKKYEETYKDRQFISAKCWDENGNEIDCSEL